MDSLTQIALGASVAGLVVGPKVGRKALAWGALCGTIPDLDVLIPMSGAVESFTYHRSFSHSVFVLSAIAPLVALAAVKLHPSTAQHWRYWFLAIFLALVTHPILDSFTVYGTQIFWPIWEYPVSLSTIFIIDPLYTLPLLFGCIGFLVVYRRPQRAQKFIIAGLVLSSAYMGFSAFAKASVESRLAATLERTGITPTRTLTTAAPLTTLLWRVIVMEPDSYKIGFVSLFDPDEDIKFETYPTQPTLLEGLEGHWPVERLKWFTHGFYSVRANSPAIVMTDLRMGSEGGYIFAFVVGRREDSKSIPIENHRRSQPQNISRIKNVFARIGDPGISMAPPK